MDVRLVPLDGPPLGHLTNPPGEVEWSLVFAVV